MPMIQLTTNIPPTELPSDFAASFTTLLANAMKRELDHFTLHVDAGRDLTVGADASRKNVLLWIRSIGYLGPQENAEYARIISEYLEQTLGVTSDRLFIHFHDLQPHEVGRWGVTVNNLTS
ncbi:CBN-MIF-2 protein [Aphelenchoides avenae]|nr:CBN-MIF-2 protein [Aphelenchus avenae]